ncbi:MAG: cupin domain-containing protein [Pyrinomonadaceae bacterium]
MPRTTYILVLTFAGLAAMITFIVFGNTTLLQESTKANQPHVEKTPPDVDYNRPPKLNFDPAGYFFNFDQLEEAYRAPGEYTHRLDGETYGFNSLSFIVTKTQPNGGPNLHVHEMEEAHVLLEGTAEYRIGDKTFRADAPYIVKVPAGVPHTFINAGKKPFNLVAVFASKKLGSKRLGPNPLVRPAPKK